MLRFFLWILLFSSVCHLYAVFFDHFWWTFLGPFCRALVIQKTGVDFLRGLKVVGKTLSKESPKCMLSVCFQINILCFWNVVFVTCPIWVHLRQDACFSVIFVCSAPSPSPQVVYKMPQLGSSRIKINENTWNLHFRNCAQCAQWT